MKRLRHWNAKYNANTRVPENTTQVIFNHLQSLDETRFKYRYLQDEVFSKFLSKDTDSPLVRRNRAIMKWLGSELNNESTNDRLFNTHDEFNILSRVRWSSFVAKCQEIVISIIGETVPLEALIGSFSGGASTSRKRTESYPASKFLGKADVTSSALHWFSLVQEELVLWKMFSDDLVLNEVRGNVLFTVPKKTTIDRCACKEPDINMFLQKGVGNYFRSSLRRKGIDLNDQSRNQRLALVGSSDGSLATIDLASASDSICSSLVELLLPPLWFGLLDDLRSKITIIDGEEHVNEMFSSMGNGFTFELESLLFYSICRTVAYFRGISGVISVYGDDIIVPTSLASDLIWVLSYLGFEVNPSKTFYVGSFRESCGHHYFRGANVTPFYIRKPIERLTDVINVANKIRQWSDEGTSILDPSLEPLWLYLRSLVPSEFWGGHDCNVDTSLVTYCEPRKCLVPVSRNVDINGAASYLHWFSCVDYRVEQSTISTSKLQRSLDRYRVRRSQHTVIGRSSIFLSEIML